MKRILISLCLILSLVLSMISVVAADNATQPSLDRVVSLGIMEGFEDGQLHEEEFVTRAEFSTMLIRMLALEQVAEFMKAETVFGDVPAEHWANQYVNLAYQNRLIEGVGNNRFEPEENITYEEAVKLLVLALGYYPMTEQFKAGEWYQKYLTVGNRIGLTNGLAIPVGTVLTRAQVGQMIDSALDVDLMVRVYDGGEAKYEIKQKHTLVDILTNGGTERYGVLEATSGAALADYGDMREQDLYIDGERYTWAGGNVDELVGKCVTYFITGTDETVILNLYEKADRNIEIAIKGSDIDSYLDDTIEYREDGKRHTTKVKLAASAAAMLNGRPYQGGVEDLVKLPNLTLRLLSNDKDAVYDVVYAENYEIGKVMRVNTFDRSIHLKNMLSNDTRSISLETSGDQVIVLKDMSGEEITLEDIKEEDTILQIRQSYDGMRIEITWLNEAFAGTVNSLNQTDESITIDDQTYEIAENLAGLIVAVEDVEVGSVYQVTLDTNEKVVDLEKELSDGVFRLGYLYQIGTNGSGLGTEVVVKMLTGTTVESVEIDDVYYTKGKEKQVLNVYDLAARVNIDGSKQEETKLLSLIQPGDVFYYSTNKDGEINKIETCSNAADYKERTLNAKQSIMAASGSGFGIDQKTVVFFVPKGNDENDLYSEMQFKSGTYFCSGFNFVENTPVVEAAVFHTGLDSSEEVTFGELDPYCIVQGVSQEIDQEGNQLYRISGYREGVEFNAVSSPDSSVASTVLRHVQTGDIIRYKTDFDGRINAAMKLDIEPGTRDPEPLSPGRRFFHVGSSSAAEEQIFGIVSEAKRKDLDTSAVKYVNRLRISLNQDGSSPEDAVLLDFDEKTAPDYYSYDYERGEITPAAFEDIISVNDSDASEASRVFAYAQNGTFKIVVIVR